MIDVERRREYQRNRLKIKPDLRNIPGTEQHTKFLEYQRSWYLRDIENNREKRRANNRRNRMLIIQEMGGACCQCGVSDWRVLQIDHVNGDGHIERKTRGHSNSALYTAVRRSPENYQLLCANCNWIKYHEEGEAYHGRK